MELDFSRLPDKHKKSELDFSLLPDKTLQKPAQEPFKEGLASQATPSMAQNKNEEISEYKPTLTQKIKDIYYSKKEKLIHPQIPLDQRVDVLRKWKPTTTERIQMGWRKANDWVEEGLLKYPALGEKAMKALLVSPDIMLGKDRMMSPRELDIIEKGDWTDVWKESPIGKKFSPTEEQLLTGWESGIKNPVTAFLHWSLGEKIPAEIAGVATKPSTYIQLAVAQLGHGILLDKLKGWQALKPTTKRYKLASKLMKDVFARYKHSPLYKDYKTLGLKDKAPWEDVKKEYRYQTKKYHPDFHGKYANTEKMQGINRAFEQLQEAHNAGYKYKEFVKPELSRLKFKKAHAIVPFEPGDVAKVGETTGKILQITGDTAILSIAGKQVTAKLAELEPITDTELSVKARKGIKELEDMEGEFRKETTKLGERLGIIKKPEAPKPLIEEAKKYKKVEEFVESKPTFYHTTSKEIVPTIEKGGFKAQIGKRSLGITKGKGIFVYKEDLAAAREFGKNFKNPSIIETKVEGKIFDAMADKYPSIRSLAEDNNLISELKSKGYVGIKGDEDGQAVHFIFEPNAIKTKSQLTSIWQQAHKPPEIPKAEAVVEKPEEYKKAEIENFNNFESKKSPISLLDKKMSEINGLRLSGKLTPQQANMQIQEIKNKKIEYAKEKGIAITRTQKGKQRIAMRKSGFYAKEEITDAPTVDVYSQFQPPSSMALRQDGYELGGEFGVIYKEVWIPTKKSIVGSIESKLKFDKEFKAIVKKNNFAITKKNGVLLSDMLEGKVKIPKEHEELVKEIRQYMDNKRDLANDVRKKMGKSAIGYIENYVPHIQETCIWNQLMGDDVTITDNFDFIIPNQAKNPFAFKRLKKEMTKPDRNFFSLVERYNSAVAKDMHINPAIENIKAYNMVLKDKGLFKSAKFWDEYIRVGLLGKQHKIDNSLSISPLVRKGLRKWKDILNKAFLTGKISWNIATQPLSYISLTPTEAGYKNAITAIFRMFNKGIRSEVSKQSLSLRIKSQDILSEAIGEGREFANRIYRTKINKLNDVISLISSIEEQLLHQASYIAGLSRAKDLGYEGEDIQMFADLVAERTQSMYNKENRALILSSDITTGAIPFQSFAVELSNHAREILTKSKGAMRLKIRQRLGKLLRLLVGIWLGNQYAKALTGREKTTVGTFIPFAGETVDRLIIKGKNLIRAKTGEKEEYVTTRSPVSILQQVDSLTKASKDYLKHGDTKRLRKLAITFAPAIFGMGGGGQLSNLVDGTIAAIEEEVKNVKGNKLFDVKDLESKLKAPIFGTWSTKGGREYWEKRKPKKKAGGLDFSTLPDKKKSRSKKTGLDFSVLPDKR